MKTYEKSLKRMIIIVEKVLVVYKMSCGYWDNVHVGKYGQVVDKRVAEHNKSLFKI